MNKIKVTIWNEFFHEKRDENVKTIYPGGIHETLKKNLACENFEITAVSLDMPEQGLTDELLNNTDVLLWWGHVAHEEVKDALVEKIQQRILDGMGLICLHSAHFSKIFRRLTGAGGTLKWREVGEHCRIWTINPAHPIAKGIPEHFELEHEEMYGEPFGIPEPDELVFISWYEGGEVFRSGCTFHRGRGNIFYFQPGHETYKTYYDKNILKVITNAINWAYNPDKQTVCCECVEPLEKLNKEN